VANLTAYVNYQNRGAQFAVGDIVYPFLDGSSDLNGRVVAVWPAIGMVDVEWPHGAQRVPVEDIQRIVPDSFFQPPEVDPGTDSVPGGAESVPVSMGPGQPTSIPEEQVTRLAAAFTKKSLWQSSQLPEFKRRLALYWASKDRLYKAKSAELSGGAYHCPKCGQGIVLKKAVYKRRGGESLHLLGCPNCLFLIKKADIMGDPNYVEMDITSNRKRRL